MKRQIYGSDYKEYTTIPSTAEISIIMMGDGFFFMIFLKTAATPKMTAKIISPSRSGLGITVTWLSPIKLLKNMVIAVEMMRPMTQGRIPPRQALTPLYFRKLLIREAMIRIMMKDGRMIPRVAAREPRTTP